MIGLPSHIRVYLALGAIDMRKEINGLSVLVEAQLELDAFSGHLFVFCNRRRTTLKILFRDRNGFALYQKRLEKDRFHWPQNREEVMEVTSLLGGLDLRNVHPHGALRHTTLIFSILLNKFIYKDAFLW